MPIYGRALQTHGAWPAVAAGAVMKRLQAELRANLGDAAPEVLHLWADGNHPQPGVALRARVADVDAEWIAEGSVPVPDWEEAYQRLFADALPKTARET